MSGPPAPDAAPTLGDPPARPRAGAPALFRPWLASTPGRRATVALLALAALAFPLLHGNDADIDAAANAGSYAALALGLNIVVGMAGLLDLGYAAFFAIGAYAYGILSSYQLAPEWTAFWQPFASLGLVEHLAGDAGTAGSVHFTVSFWIMLPASAAISALCGMAFGAPTLRLRGDYLAIVTLGFGEIVPIVVRNTPWLTNGAAGLNGIAPPSLLGRSFGVDALPYYYVMLALVGVLIFASLRLRDSRVGRAWMAIREDETAASAMGVDTVRFKLLAFAIGAGFAGATGTFFVAKLQTATPEMFGYPVSVMVLVMVVLGGMGSVWGVVLGAVSLQLLQSWLLPDMTGWLHDAGRAFGNAAMQRVDLSQATELIFGVVLVAMMLFRRDGLIPASRSAAALTFAQQHADVSRPGAAQDGFATLGGFGAPRDAAAAPRALLEVRGLTVRFGGLVALDAVDLVVPEGGVVAVIGPNGSGKSTLFNAITGLVRAQGGSILFDGQEIRGLRPDRILRRGLARTFQNIRLFPTLSVLDNVLVGTHARLRAGPLRAVLRLPATRREESDARARATGIVACFGNRLLPRLGQSVGGLSYANRRRVEIARALASGPRLLLLDEPTAGMNPAETLELAEQIRALHQSGLTVLVIEHKLDVVVRLADTVIVLDHGVKLTEGPPAVVRRDERVLSAYLGRGAREAVQQGRPEALPLDSTQGSP
ncbi:MAG: branched-chain amino acid ABC transporter ATP-binding protein/permease [Janthinobacterium lividum]